MKSVIVKRMDLINIVETNMLKHREEFEKAFAGYRVRIVQELEKLLDDAQQGRVVEHFIRLPIPEDHTTEYQQVIEMLVMEVRDEVEIDHRTFRQYVMDEWDWKGQFTATNMTYGS